MSISGHKLTTGIGFGFSSAAWRTAADPNHNGFSTFDNIVSQIGANISYFVACARIQILWDDLEPEAPLTITNATNATPIEITTSAAHGLGTGDVVSITGVGNNNSAAANGWDQTITVTGSTTFTLDGSVGDGVYSEGVVHLYDYSHITNILDHVNAVVGKGGVGLKAGIVFMDRTFFSTSMSPAPDWAVPAPYDYVYQSPDIARKRQLKKWETGNLTCGTEWSNLIEAFTNYFKDDLRIAHWELAPEIGRGHAALNKTESGFTDAAYHASVLRDMEAGRRGDPTATLVMAPNIYVGSFTETSIGTYWQELLDKMEELVISPGPSPDPHVYAKSTYDYNNNTSLFHKTKFLRWRNSHSIMPIVASCDSGVIFKDNIIHPPWSLASSDDPYPETADYHLANDNTSRVTFDTLFYYLLNYVRCQFVAVAWPSSATQSGEASVTQLRQEYIDAAIAYTNSFPGGPDPYTAGAPVGPTEVTEYRLNCAGTEAALADSRVFEADENGPSPSAFLISSPSTVMTSTTIENAPYTTNTLLPASNAYFEYTLPATNSNKTLTPGVYDVTIYAQEGFWTAAGQRSFHIDVQGARVETGLDLYSEAGAQFVEVKKTYQGIVSAGQIVIRFTGDTGATDPKATVNAIEIVQSSPIVPAEKTFARINVGASQPHTTTDGRTFEADNESAWTNGSSSSKAVTATTSTIGQAPYQTRRLGPITGYMERNFTGLANGTDWTAKLYFLEPYWTSAAARSFDIEIPPATVLESDYDIYSEAGAGDDEIISQHTGLTVSDNTLTVRLSASATYPDPKSIIYAIELTKGTGTGGGSQEFRTKRGNIDLSGFNTPDSSFTAVADVAATLETIPNALKTASGDAAGTGGQANSIWQSTLELQSISQLYVSRSSSTAATRVPYHLLEYIGSGDNSYVVRHRSLITLNSVGTGTATITGATDITKCVPFISVANASSVQRYSRTACTAKILTGSNEVEVERANTANTTKAAVVVIEFTGSNWTVQQNIEHTFSSAGSDETETVSDVVDWAQCLVYPTFRANRDDAAGAGVTVRPGANTTTLRHWLQTGATISSQVSNSFIIKNANLVVEHLDSITGALASLPAGDGVNPQTENRTCSLVTLAESFLIPQATDSSTASDSGQRAAWSAALSSTMNVQLWKANYDGAGGEVVLQVAQMPRSGSTDVTAPTAPANLVVSALTATELRATCDPATDEETGIDYYEWELDSVVDSDTTEIPQKDFTGLTEYTQYSVRVRAYDNAANVSAWDGPAVGRTADETAPSTPVINSVDVAGEVQTFHITPSTDGGSGVIAYDFYDGDEFYISVDVVDFTVDGAEIVTDINSIEVSRYWRAVGVDADGNESDFSATFEVLSGNAPPAPISVQAFSASETSMNLSWDAAPAATGYKVYLVPPSVTSDTLITSIAVTTYVETGLASWQTRYYKVSATNTNGEGPKSAVFSGRTLDLTAPAGGVINDATQQGATVIFDITPATDAGSGVAGYYLWNDVGEITLGEPPYAIITDANPQADISFTGATYSWTIEPFDVAGNVGTMSAAVELVALSTYPDYPQSYDNDRDPLDQVSWDRANGNLRGRVLHTKDNYEFSIVHPNITDAQRQILDSFWTQNRGVLINLVLQDTGETHQCYMRKRAKFIPIAYDGTDHSFKAIVEFIQ